MAYEVDLSDIACNVMTELNNTDKKGMDKLYSILKAVKVNEYNPDEDANIEQILNPTSGSNAKIKIGDYRFLVNIDKDQKTLSIIHAGNRKDCIKALDQEQVKTKPQLIKRLSAVQGVITDDVEILENKKGEPYARTTLLHTDNNGKETNYTLIAKGNQMQKFAGYEKGQRVTARGKIKPKTSTKNNDALFVSSSKNFDLAKMKKQAVIER